MSSCSSSTPISDKVASIENAPRILSATFQEEVVGCEQEN